MHANYVLNKEIHKPSVYAGKDVARYTIRLPTSWLDGYINFDVKDVPKDAVEIPVISQEERRKRGTVQLHSHFVIDHQGECTTDGIKFTNFDLLDQDFVNQYKKNKKEKNSNNLNYLQNSQLKDIEYIKLPRVLKYTDRIAMKYGIETRVPILNHKLINYCFHLNNILLTYL